MGPGPMGIRLAPILIAVVAALVVAGCGGDDGNDTTTSSTSSLTKQQFVREANQICKQTDDKIERASKQFFADAPPDEEAPPAEIEQFAKQTALPAIEDEIDRIRALGAPQGDEDEVKAILDAAQEGLDKLEQDPDEIAQGGAAPALEKFDKLAGDYGLDKCAEA